MVWRMTRSYRWVRKRIDDLEEVLLPSERFIFVFGFVEKIIRRTFVHICVSNGKSEGRAVEESKKSNLMTLNRKWKQETSRTLRDLIGKDAWRTLHHAAELRNELIHGGGHKDERAYGKTVEELLGILDDMRKTFSSEYGYSGWKKR